MSAVLSPCGLYRYRLDRQIDGLLNADGPVVGFCLHNPSTADAERDDPTSRRGIGFARAWGASRLIYVNPWAGRATKPADLWRMDDPVGIKNDQHIFQAALECCRTGGWMVAAWGAVSPPARMREAVRDRLIRVENLIRFTGCPLHALDVNADGSPKHPLYLRADAIREPWPHRADRVDLGPGHAADLAGAGRREDDEFERAGREGRAQAQCAEEGRDLGVGQRGVMPAAQALGSRQDRLKVPALARRVITPRWPAARAVSNTRSIRPRRRRAVSGFSCQIGRRAASTAVVSTSATGMAHIPAV